MTLDKIKKLFKDKGCGRILVKRLAANDNSKNQVYLGGSFDVLNILPFMAITADDSGDWNKTRFKAALDFSWISDNGSVERAPSAQLILYPKYPEVRFSGFLAGCKSAPSALMANRIADRLLFFGVTQTGAVLGYVSSPDSPSTKEFGATVYQESHGVFTVVSLSESKKETSSRVTLLGELQRIHQLGWIDSKRLNSNADILDCNAPNCGGYTLEAELGITPNGYSEPDFLGWEVKQFGVTRFDRLNSSTITLMTPEPTDGIYRDEGVEKFIRDFGYADRNGKPDRLNFGGVHKVDERHHLTGLTMKLPGFDSNSGKIKDATGSIALISDKGEVAASWSFSSLIKHWSRKHANASYVPSMNLKVPNRKYSYGNEVILGSGTRFDLFLQQMNDKNIYYDPGIKMENASTTPKIKRRSQFRIRSKNLAALYEKNELIDLLKL